MREPPSGRTIVTVNTVNCECGVEILNLDEDGRVLVGGEALAFRRTTDHVVCSNCGRQHRVVDLRRQAGLDDDAPPEEFVIGSEEDFAMKALKDLGT